METCGEKTLFIRLYTTEISGTIKPVIPCKRKIYVATTARGYTKHTADAPVKCHKTNSETIRIRGSVSFYTRTWFVHKADNVFICGSA